jgi:pyridoxine kinase
MPYLSGMQQKRVLAVHDISCVGKCSLTVALPIISATGVECSALPTAVLSTHTGGFKGYTFRDLTDDIEPILNHWKSLDVKFDGVYTGYLGSARQVELVEGIFAYAKKNDAQIFVDPVMADDGKMYPGFELSFAQGMKDLCTKADVIMPNITEACFMLKEEYKPGPYTRDYIEGLLKRLSALGPKKVVLTGVYFDDKMLGAASYDADAGKTEYSFHERIPGYYHGTGDIFGSVVVAAVMNGLSLAKATELAVDFTWRSIVRTHDAGTDVRFGVNFEAGFPKLLADMGLGRN